MSYTEQYIQQRRTDQHGCLDVSDAIELLERADDEIAALREEIERLQKESAAFAAGQCVVKYGLLGDEGGTPYCSLRRHAAAVLSRISPGCDDRTFRIAYERTLRHIAGLPNDEGAAGLSEKARG